MVPFVNMGSDRTLIRDLMAVSLVEDRSKLISKNLMFRLYVIIVIVLCLGVGSYICVDDVWQAITPVCVGMWVCYKEFIHYSLYDFIKLTTKQNIQTVMERLVAIVLIASFFCLMISGDKFGY